MQNNNLYKRVHWRNVKLIFRQIAKLETFTDIKDYDLNNICCYECTGYDLQGFNVKYETYSNESCWVKSNSYEIFESPKFTNSQGYLGEFLYIAHNTNFDYWTMGTLKTSKDDYKTTTASNYLIREKAYFEPFGKYDVSINDSYLAITKTLKGKDFTFGGVKGKEHAFDENNVRKNSYKTSRAKIMSNMRNKKYKQNKIIDKKSVRKYKKNKNY